MRVPHEPLGAEHIALAQQRADVGGAHGDAVKLYLFHDIAGKAVLRAVGAQKLGIALAAPAETEIVSDNEPRDAELCADALQEFAPRHVHGLVREAEKLHAVDAEETADEVRAVGRAVDELHRPALHERVGVRIECHNGGLDAELRGALRCAAEKRGMAEVHAVKEAEREHAFLFCHK